MKPVPNVRRLICKDNCTGGDQGALFLRRHAGQVRGSQAQMRALHCPDNYIRQTPGSAASPNERPGCCLGLGDFWVT